MRRWTLLLAGAALWLFLAAIPTLADGGPHVASVNNGSGPGGLTADGCAGCHRAHSAQTATLLIQPSETALCLTCHGGGSTGATTNVVNGVQFVPASSSDPLHRNASGVILGALRDGGFVTAAIGSSSAYKWVRALPYSNYAKVPVRVDGTGAIAGQSVTSAHMNVPGSPLTSANFTGTTWGNFTTTPGDNVGATGGTLLCSSCHNPHGNNQYRILNPQPAVGGGDFKQVDASTGIAVTDAALPLAGDTRNYTVIQTMGGTGTLTANQVTSLVGYTNVAGDYLRKQVPWNGVGTEGVNYAWDAPNGDSGRNFNAQINAWCATCHSRYLSAGSSDTTNANAIFHNRHYNGTTAHGYPVCTTCHVGHGSNAQMTPNGYSATIPYPGGAAAPAGDSRLLKVDNRGICQTCHDPTHTITAGTYLGPVPNPIVP